VNIKEFARSVIDALEAAGVTYMLGGSLALTAWGEARSTQDVDLVVELLPVNMERLSRELEQRDMLVPVDTMQQWLEETRADIPINAIHMRSIFKAEFFLLKPNDALRQQAIKRRRLTDLGPPLGKVYVHSPEDLILYKVRFYNTGYQTKHVRDIASILLSQGETLDMAYIDAWVRRMNWESAWADIRFYVPPF